MGKSTHWATIFAVVAVISALLGFGGAAGSAAPAAIVLCWVSVGIMIVSLAGNMLRGA